MCTLNVQFCKSRKNVLLYISKRDEFPFFNCRDTDLPFAYKAKVWARCTQVWRVSDPFVLEHEQHYMLLYELHWEVWSRSPCANQCLNLFETFSLAGACSCYDCTLYVADWIVKVCIYTDPRVLEKHCTGESTFVVWVGTMVVASARKFLFGSFVRCEYDVVLLNSSNLTIYGKRYIKSNIYSKEDFWTWSYKQEFQTYKIKLPVAHGMIWWCNFKHENCVFWLSNSVLFFNFECNVSLRCGEPSASALFTSGTCKPCTIILIWLYWYN